MNDKIANILIRLCKALGFTIIANIIDFREDISQEKLYKTLDEFVETIEKKYKKGIFEFHDRKSTFLKKNLIFQASKVLNLGGEPCIRINDFPDGMKLEKNPALHVELYYSDIAIRDTDFEELKLFLK